MLMFDLGQMAAILENGGFLSYATNEKNLIHSKTIVNEDQLSST